MEQVRDIHQISEQNMPNLAAFQRLQKNLRNVENPGLALDKTQEVRSDNRAHDVNATPDNVAQIEKAVKILELFEPHHPETRFQFQVHSETGKIQVRLVNKKTGEVVEEVPSSKLLDFNSKLEELTGLTLEKKA